MSAVKKCGFDDDRDAVSGCVGGHGKVILLGEHAVVYGHHAIAAPIADMVQARVLRQESGQMLSVPLWGIEARLDARETAAGTLQRAVQVILRRLGLADIPCRIEVYPTVMPGSGMGGSASIAVAVSRALSLHSNLKLTDADINATAFEAEKVAHGSPSGIDNTVATYGQLLLFKSGTPAVTRPIQCPHPLNLVIGASGSEGLTLAMVHRVREAHQRRPALVDAIFQQIDRVALDALEALERGRLDDLGELMNINHGLLGALQVSTPQLEALVHIARDNGAVGAKITGAGGGGAIVALCPRRAPAVERAMQQAGYCAVQISV